MGEAQDVARKELPGKLVVGRRMLPCAHVGTFGPQLEELLGKD